MTGKDYHMFQTIVEQIEDAAVRAKRYSENTAVDPLVREYQKGLAVAGFEAVRKIKAVLVELNR